MVIESLRFLVLLSWGLLAAGLAWYCLSISQKITYVTLADGRQQERKLPLMFRLLIPFVPNLDGLVMRPAFEKKRAVADRQLVSAGFEGLLSGREMTAIQLLLPVVGGIVMLIGVKLLLLLDPGLGSNALLVFLGGTAMCYVYPVIWLRGVLGKRHREIQKSLPFVLDLLTLSVESGMDFMSALQRNCERRKLDALNEELIRMVREVQVGTTRRTALKNLSTRVNLPDLKSVVHALVQADELGVSIGAILRIQSDQMRQRRFERAEKLANEAPTKMLGPLMLFIFPATIIILLGPILLKAMENML